MGQGTPGGMGKQGLPGDRKRDGDKKDKKFEPAVPPSRVGRKQRKQKGLRPLHASLPLRPLRVPPPPPQVRACQGLPPHGEEFVANQERLLPKEEKNEADRSKIDDLRVSPMSVGNLEGLIDETMALFPRRSSRSTTLGSCPLSTRISWNRDVLSLCITRSVIDLNDYLGWEVLSIVGLLQDEVDPTVSCMKVEKAPLELYADIDGLDAQIQEIN
ncbi:hypothetical protein BHM03_00038469 [Ensete ventricosum]|nr:hypothetical protein BHM03_00038469 [Ensete ventricosum]